MILRLALLLAAALASTPALALDCGGADAPCTTASGAYHIALPEDWDGGPAIIHLHGYGSTGANVIRNTGFVAGFTERGYAVIAPTALPWLPGKPTDWSVRDGFTYDRDDLAFLREVRADAEARAGIDPARLLLTGFSRGGSMVWEVACLDPAFAAAYAPAAGGFWLPLVEECVGPVKLLHTHGFGDKMVPLEGRKIIGWRNKEFIQDDVWRGLQLWRRINGCPDTPAGHDAAEALWRKRWDCAAGSLEIALHPGGHGLPKGWTGLVLDWFEFSDQ